MQINRLMKTKFLPLKKIRLLEEAIGWLSSYKNNLPDEETHVVGESLEEVDLKSTLLLRELGELNIRRQQIIDQLMRNSPVV